MIKRVIEFFSSTGINAAMLNNRRRCAQVVYEDICM